MRSFEQLVDLFLGCVQMLSRIMLDFINVRRALLLILIVNDEFIVKVLKFICLKFLINWRVFERY